MHPNVILDTAQPCNDGSDIQGCLKAEELLY
jgi:hypothetical protein